MEEYPSAVAAFHEALERLPGIRDASSGIVSLHGLKEKDLSLLPYADLPLGALRRTKGGLAREALVQFEFEATPDEAGWRSLEFLAWFVRDQSRGGEPIQLRPKALPPATPDAVQLGSTLRFQIDLFWPKAGKNLAPAFKHIQALADQLRLMTKSYDRMLKERGDRGLL